MKEYLTSKDEVVKSLNSSYEGLSAAEAKKRLEKNGPNKLREGKKIQIFNYGNCELHIFT